MPRTARKKGSECSYHIMCRSISEVDLFQDEEDKEYYMTLLKRYKEKYECAIIAYSLMENHLHLYLDPKGFDVSTFMHSVNSAYVVHFNTKHKRHGPLFQGRFASKIIETDAYALTLSAYIHNNAKDIPGYNGREEDYPFSSYGVYIGKRKDEFKIVDSEFILKYFSKNKKEAAKKYLAFTASMRENGIMKEIDEDIWDTYIENEYRSEKKHIERDKKPEDVVKKACELLKEDIPETIRVKNCRRFVNLRAFVIYTMRVMCGLTYKKIGEFIGDMSLSGVIRLAGKGFELINADKNYKKAFKSIVLIT